MVDLLHEFELGIFKSVFKHLLRILYAIDPRVVSILNDRLVYFASKLMTTQVSRFQGSAKFPHLEGVRSDDSLPMFQTSDNAVLGTLRTFSRFGFPFDL